MGMIAFILPGGCATGPVNPSFPISARQADRDLARMAKNPVCLERPLVIISGFMDPGVAAGSLKSRFQSLTLDRRIVTVVLGAPTSLDECREKIVSAVERAFPSNEPGATIECDVIGYSLGGLAARYAALPIDSPDEQQLRIRRLFTISTPHRGANQAEQLPLLHPIQASLRIGSDELMEINAREPDFPIFAYILLGDHAIGEVNAAPPGHVAWWVSCPPLSDPHFAAYHDPRILADIARRLRYEPPLATDPPTDLPRKK